MPRMYSCYSEHGTQACEVHTRAYTQTCIASAYQRVEEENGTCEPSLFIGLSCENLIMSDSGPGASVHMSIAFSVSVFSVCWLCSARADVMMGYVYGALLGAVLVVW